MTNSFIIQILSLVAGIIVMRLCLHFAMPQLRIIRGILDTKFRVLDKEAKHELKKCGIKHYTSQESAIAIAREGVILPCAKTAIFPFTKRYTYFFMNKEIPEFALWYNFHSGAYTSPRDCVISISNLSQAQINAFKTRRIDNAMIYLCNHGFVFQPFNEVYVDSCIVPICPEEPAIPKPLAALVVAAAFIAYVSTEMILSHLFS